MQANLYDAKRRDELKQRVVAAYVRAARTHIRLLAAVVRLRQRTKIQPVGL